MRKLIVTRGLPGSGKSHTLADLGLSDLTIGADALRLILASPIMMADGRMAISPEYDAAVWKQMFDILAHRMARGETVVVDATHPSEADFSNYLQLAREHRYEIACLDFSEVPADVALWGNDGRAEHRIVPQRAVDKISAKMAAGMVPDGVQRIVARANRSHLAEAKAWLNVPVVDLSDYRRVVHVGDIQGCHTALLSLLDGGLRDDTFYVFVGDYCDRGDENGDGLRWLIDNVMGRDQCALLFGNHVLGNRHTVH
jgi:predicted kinase